MSTIPDRIPTRSHPVSLRQRLTRASLALVYLLVGFGSDEVVAQEAQPADDLMEVFWEFRYSGGVNTVIESRYDGQRFYISMGDLFGALQVNIVQEPSQNMVHGFFVDTSRPYEIDFNAGRMLLGNTEIRFDSTDFVREELGYFLELSLYEPLFDMTITLDERNLSMSLTTPDEMPVVAEARRRANRVIREEQTFLQRNAPLLFDRDRSVASGGVVGYRMSTQMTGTSPRASLNLRGGGELLGGDLELGLSGNYATVVTSGESFNFDVDSWRWRYVTRNLPALRQAQVGELSSDGLRSFSYRGARISNDPVDVQRFFGSYPMRIESEPGWEVEIYLNNQLIDVQQSDATGVVNFSVPITYGSTSVTVREYGPTGEYRESQRRIQVPFTFVPPGEVRYNLFAGQALNGDRELVQATTSIGITSWLTAKWGFDYVTADESRPGEELANLSWGSVSARIGPSYIFTVRAAPGALYSASANAFFPSLASFALNFTQYEENRIYNQSGRQHESRATMNLPLRLGSLPVNLRTTVSERMDGNDTFAFTGQQNVTFNPGVFRLDLGFRGDARYINEALVPSSMRFEPRLGYSFARGSGVPRPLRGLLLSVRSSYDVRDSDFLSLTANFSRRIGGSLRLQTDIGQQFQRNETTFTVRLSMDLNSIRTTTGARIRTANAPSFTQDVSGALSYDTASGRLAVSNRDWVGRSAATIRMFVDYNGNDRHDEDEPIIENGGVSFRRAVSTQRGPDGHLLVYNLQAYEQYNLTVDQSRIRNPFWVPKMEEFSFVTDPNVHKLIEIPFLVTGEVSGSVLREGDAGLRAVPGLRLHVEQIDGTQSYEEPVFSDGSFYKLGILPGSYRAWVDSSQTQILGVTSDPPVQEFTVAPSEMGDSVDGIDFVLRQPDADEAEDGEPADDAPEDAPPADEAPEDAAPADDADAADSGPYVVEEGLEGFEGLREIARRVYGDTSLWPKIWLANTDLLDDPSDLTAGMELVIPEQAPLTPIERAAGAGYEAELETDAPDDE